MESNQMFIRNANYNRITIIYVELITDTCAMYTWYTNIHQKSLISISFQKNILFILLVYNQPQKAMQGRPEY